MVEDDGVLRRWHRRKTAARRGDPVERGIEPEDDPAALPVAPEPDATAKDGEPLVPDLPDIDSLDADSDFSPFLGEGVPEAVQRLALRKLWRLDPVLANLDGLVDYGEDFTDASMTVEGLRTAYRVGKGMLTDEEHAAMPGADAETALPVSEADDAPDQATSTGDRFASDESADGARPEDTGASPGVEPAEETGIEPENG